MKYHFWWTSRARKQLRAIDQGAAIGLLRALAPLGEDPRRRDRDIKQLAGSEDLYRLRVGSHRIVYAIRDDRLVVLVVAVGGRGQDRGLGRGWRSGLEFGP